MFQFRQMEATDIAAGLHLCRAAHWNQTQRDWEALLQLHSAGCRVALQDDQVVGTVTTTRYQNHCSWIGMVLVDPAVRGQGLGTALMQQALHLLSNESVIKLDATPAGHRVYVPLGFRDEESLSRIEGYAPALTASVVAARPMEQEDFTAVCEMDAKAFGASRRALLEWWWQGAREYAWVVYERDALVGYCLGRHGHQFEQLGPVVARDAMVAQQLATACWRAPAKREFILDIPLRHPAWLNWLAALGFREQRPFIRMARGGDNIRGLAELQFAIMGPELG